MKIQIRRGLFETNSSSIHTLVLTSENEYNMWKNGELVFDRFKEMLIPVTDETYIKWKEQNDNGEIDDDYNQYLTYEDFFEDWDMLPYETFEENYTSESGDKVIAFGYYGHD